MNVSERRIKIYEQLQQKGYVEINDLAKQFAVSTMTIRRDLAIFEKDGLLQVHYGGASLVKTTVNEPSYRLKTSLELQAKKEIAYQASLLVSKNDTIFLDCGTTCLELAKVLKNKKITIITNSLNIVNLFDEHDKAKLIVVGGEYSLRSQGFISHEAIVQLNNYIVDKSFISTQGFDFEKGLTIADTMEAQVKKAAFNCSKQRILLVDHTKFNKSFFAKHASIQDIDLMITSKGLAEDLQLKLKDLKVAHIIA